MCVGWGNTCTVIPYYLLVKNLCKITKKIDHNYCILAESVQITSTRFSDSIFPK